MFGLLPNSLIISLTGQGPQIKQEGIPPRFPTVAFIPQMQSAVLQDLILTVSDGQEIIASSSDQSETNITVLEQNRSESEVETKMATLGTTEV